MLWVIASVGHRVFDAVRAEAADGDEDALLHPLAVQELPEGGQLTACGLAQVEALHQDGVLEYAILRLRRYPHALVVQRLDDAGDEADGRQDAGDPVPEIADPKPFPLVQWPFHRPLFKAAVRLVYNLP
jgi:hypothetical protein